MFEVLERSGLSRKLLPELQRIPAALSKASSLPVRFALLTWGLTDVTALCDRLRAPNEVRELALTANRVKDQLERSTPDGLLELLKRADAFRRPERFAELLEAARLAEPGIDTARIERALKAAAAVDAGAVAAKASSPAQIPQLIDEARLKAIGRAP
jgi:tRNA nucleotidyltransferase (CCA-adding enzyme)